MVLASIVAQNRWPWPLWQWQSTKPEHPRLAWEQVALASSMDSVAFDSFQWSSMPSSQMALHLQVSMDAFVVSSSSRAWLVFRSYKKWKSSVKQEQNLKQAQIFRFTQVKLTINPPVSNLHDNFTDLIFRFSGLPAHTADCPPHMWV